MSGRSLGGPLAALLGLALLSCGGGSASAPQEPAVVPPPAVLRTTCAESWWPTSATFTNRHWRAQSVFAGPVTFLNAKRLARLATDGEASVKIRTLVRPETPVTIAIGRRMRRTAGFVPLNNGGEAGIEASRPVLHLEGCTGVPRDSQALRGLSDIGFPVFVATTKAHCVDLEVTPEGRRTQHVVVSLGAGKCATR